MNLWPKTRTDLLARLKSANDQSSWDEFYSMYWRAIYSYAMYHGLDREDSEDIVQEVFIKIIRNFPAFQYDESKGRLRSWVKTIARTTVIDFFRRKNARLSGQLKAGQEESDEVLARLTDPNQKSYPDIWEEQWEKSVFLHAMERVKERTRGAGFKAFYLYAVENKPPADVASALGMSINSVYVHKTRILGMIREEAEKLIKETQSNDQAKDDSWKTA